MDIDLAVGIRNEQPSLGEELHGAASVGAAPTRGQRTDVRLVDRGVSADPGQHDAQAAADQAAQRVLPAAAPRVPVELRHQRFGRRSQCGQLVQRADGDAAPVAAHLEQHLLPRVGQMRRDRRSRRPVRCRALAGDIPGNVCTEVARAALQRERELAAKPQLRSGLAAGVRPVLGDVHRTGPTQMVSSNRRSGSPTPDAGAEGMPGAESPALTGTAPRLGMYAPAVAVDTTSRHCRISGLDLAMDAARAEHPGSAYHLARPLAEPGQVIERIGGDEVLAVGVADGQRKPRHPHQGVRRDLGEPALGGQRERVGLQGVLAAENAVTDAGLVLIGELASRPDQGELPRQGWR